jgi:hypothetical protein
VARLRSELATADAVGRHAKEKEIRRLERKLTATEASYQVYKYAGNAIDERYLSRMSDGAERWTLTRGDANHYTKADAEAIAKRQGSVFIGHTVGIVRSDRDYKPGAGIVSQWTGTAQAPAARRNPIGARARARPPAGKVTRRVAAASGLFRSFTGRPGKPAGYVDIPDDDVLVIVGNCEAIAYNAVRGGKRSSYQHEFAKKSRPVLAASSDGNRLYLIAGKYRFTARGIVDR